MALVRVKDKNGVETTVSEEWLTRWPDDFTLVEEEAPDGAPAPAEKPSNGTPEKKEK